MARKATHRSKKRGRQKATRRQERETIGQGTPEKDIIPSAGLYPGVDPGVAPAPPEEPPEISERSAGS